MSCERPVSDMDPDRRIRSSATVAGRSRRLRQLSLRTWVTNLSPDVLDALTGCR